MNESYGEKEIGKRENGDSYQRLLDELRNILKSHFLNSENLVEIFDGKFKEGDVVQLLDENGEALIGLDGKRVEPVLFEKIDRHNKELYVRGLLYSFSLNSVDLREKLLGETKLLEVLEREGSQIKELIKNCENN